MKREVAWIYLIIYFYSGEFPPSMSGKAFYFPQTAGERDKTGGWN